MFAAAVLGLHWNELTFDANGKAANLPPPGYLQTKPQRAESPLPPNSHVTRIHAAPRPAMSYG